MSIDTLPAITEAVIARDGDVVFLQVDFSTSKQSARRMQLETLYKSLEAVREHADVHFVILESPITVAAAPVAEERCIQYVLDHVMSDSLKANNFLKAAGLADDS